MNEDEFNSEDVLDVITQMLQAEYDALIANHIEHDDKLVAEKRHVLEKYLTQEVSLNFGRPEKPDEQWFKDGKEIAQTIALRTLFQIKKYSHTKFGELYRAYVSLPYHFKSQSSYYSNFFFSDTEEGIKLISIYDIDTHPDREGPRFEDGSLSWVWQSGVKLESLGELELIWQIEPPTRQEHLDEYNS